MKVITNNQYHAALAEIETLIEKGFNNLTDAETEELKRFLSLSCYCS